MIKASSYARTYLGPAQRMRNDFRENPEGLGSKRLNHPRVRFLIPKNSLVKLVFDALGESCFHSQPHGRD